MKRVPQVILALLVVFAVPVVVWQVVKYRALAVDLAEDKAALERKLERMDELREQARLLNTMMRNGMIVVPAVTGERRLVLRSCNELYDNLDPPQAPGAPPLGPGEHHWAGVYCSGHWEGEPDRVFTVVALKKPLKDLASPEAYVFKPQEDREP